MVGRVIVISTALAATLLVLLLQVTNPSTAGPLGLLAVFFLVYIIMLGVITELLWVGSHVLQVATRRFTTRRPLGRLSLTRAYYLSTVVALGPVIALAMRSIGSLGVYELILITVFIAIGLLYISRRSS